MKNKKMFVVVCLIVIAFVVISFIYFNKSNKDIKLNIKPNDVVENFEALNNNTIEVTYNKTQNQVTPNEVNLDDGFKLSLNNYEFYYDESRNEYALNLCIEFLKENTKLVNVMYYDILYNKEYMFYGDIYGEFKNLKFYEEGIGGSMTRIDDEETEANNSVKDVPIFYFHNNLELKDLSFSLYNIKYQVEGDPTWYLVDNQRVTFNISIEE